MPRFTRIKSVLSCFRRDDRGSVAMVIGLSALALFIIAGMVVDVGRTLVARDRLQHALDDAGLAVGSTVNEPSDAKGACATVNSSGDLTYMPYLATKFLNANFDTSLGTTSPVTVCESTDGLKLSLSSTVTVKTAFMSIFPISSSYLYAAAVTMIDRQLTGLETIMVVDNTGSMSNQITNPPSACSSTPTAICDVQYVTKQFVDSLWSAAGVSTSSATGPDSLYVGIVPFSTSVNLANVSTTNASNGTASIATTPQTQIMGNDINQTVANVVNTSAVTTATRIDSLPSTSIPCGWNGSWNTTAGDYIHPLDLIHLAQDLCIQTIVNNPSVITWNTSSNKSLPTFTFSGSTYGSVYLLDTRNSSTKYAWSGCVEARTLDADNTATPYREPAIASTGTSILPTAYDYEMTTNDITTTTPTADKLWHIYRYWRTGYTQDSGLPTYSSYYQPTSWSPSTASSFTFTFSGTQTAASTITATYYWPTETIAIAVTCPKNTTALTCNNDLKNEPTNLTKVTVATTLTSGANANAYYWGTNNNSTLIGPSSSSNNSCTNAPILPLTNNYNALTTEISDFVASGNTYSDVAMAWGARALNASGSLPYGQRNSIETTILQPNGVPYTWNRAVVFMTDGQANLGNAGTNSGTIAYAAYGEQEGNPNVTISPALTIPWKTSSVGTTTLALAGDPTLAGLEMNIPGYNTTPPSVPNGPAFSGTSCAFGIKNSGTTNNDYMGSYNSGQSTVNQYQTMCRAYYVCQQLRAANVIMFTVFFNHGNLTPGDSTAWLEDCTADGKGNIAPNNYYTATDGDSLASAFAAIGAQLANLRVTQ